MPNWEKIRNEWETTKITLAELSEKHSVKLGTLKSRKSREKWSRDATKKDATKSGKVATTNQTDATPKNTKAYEQEVFVESDELTEKQRLFCLFYVKYWNATKAYQKAYDCDYFSAMSAGSRLLRNVKIIDEINKHKKAIAEGIMLDGTVILQKYIDIAFTDITDYVSFGRREVPVIGEYGPIMDEDGNQVMQEVNYVDLKESSMIDGSIVTEVKQGKDGISIKLADKMKALDFLSKYMDLLSENDKKRLQEEKLKMDIEKSKAEVKSLNKTEDKRPLKIIVDYGDES